MLNAVAPSTTMFDDFYVKYRIHLEARLVVRVELCLWGGDTSLTKRFFCDSVWADMQVCSAVCLVAYPLEV